MERDCNKSGHGGSRLSVRKEKELKISVESGGRGRYRYSVVVNAGRFYHPEEKAVPRNLRQS